MVCLQIGFFFWEDFEREDFGVSNMYQNIEK